MQWSRRSEIRAGDLIPWTGTIDDGLCDYFDYPYYRVRVSSEHDENKYGRFWTIDIAARALLNSAETFTAIIFVFAREVDDQKNNG